MSTQDIQPKLPIMFYIKNFGLLLKLKRANRKRGEDFVKSNKKLEKPLYPKSEGNQGPMEEGMIYVLFNSAGQDGIDNIDTSFRFFWVDAPSMHFSVVDSFIVSEQFSSQQWAKAYSKGILLNKTKNRYHQEVTEPEVDFLIDGTWNKGYFFEFHDKKLHIKAKLNYTPLNEKGIICYYNGRMAIIPSMAQVSYDGFAFTVTGEIEIEGKKVRITNGRGIIEHGIGIFSTFHIYDWRWLNLQFPNGTVHLFYHSFDLAKEGIFIAGEGALVLDDEWYHFQPYDFTLEEIGFAEDQNLPSKVPIKWKVTGGKDTQGKNLLDLHVTANAKLSWIGGLGKENEYITNYVLKAEGTWKGKRIQGKGTLENQMHRIIE